MEGGAAELFFRAATWDHCTFPETEWYKAMKEGETEQERKGVVGRMKKTMSYEV